MSKVASVSTGVFLTIIRLCEPYFMYQVKKRFYAFFGIYINQKQAVVEEGSATPHAQAREKEKMKRKDIQKNTLNTYLTQSLNLELVNIILRSIVSFTQQSLNQ